MLAHVGFHAAFLTSLEQLGFQSEQTRVFWLDPEPDIVLKNVLDRGRQSQKGHRLESAVRAVNWYRGEATNIDCQRIATAADAVALIDAFFQT